MAKRKAESSNSTNGVKKAKRESEVGSAKPLDPANLLDDSDSSSEDDGGVKLDDGFKINTEYAKRFEHNKKREELQRLEEKYQKPAQPVKGQYGDKYDEDSESSDDEDEDDDGFLATEDLDAEISATLQAIRSKDPRVYDEKVTFYRPIEEVTDGDEQSANPKKEKPMYLQDYHRENLLKGYTGDDGDADETTAPRTFAQEQDDLKKTIVKEMHAAAADSSGSEDEKSGFLVPKSRPELPKQTIHPSRAAKIEVDVTVADKDPETFLSNFMAARAWVPKDGVRWQPLESDDEEEDDRADTFETAYNLRFEDPTKSNEILKSYARDVVAAKSVRREEPNSRKKQRDAQREKKEAEKREIEEEKARLRRLKIEEMEEKLQKVKKAAGIRGKVLKDDEWTQFLDDGWDDARWEAEMNKRFGEDYYAEEEGGSETDDENSGSKKKKPKKPKWDDDIDIKDIIPEFQEEEEAQEQPAFTLSDTEDENEDDENEDAEVVAKRSKTKKDRQQEKLAKKKAARLERQKIEDLVDNKLDFDETILPGKSSKQATRFRYRETSPTSFGLTARDILMATDSSLNQFAGLKKMATFRDAEKKRKDKKSLGKKARLRQWRKETFGNEDGPEIIVGASTATSENAGVSTSVDIIEGSKKKKKRSRKSKGVAIEA